MHTDNGLVTKTLCHDKYLHGRISYYPNSSAAFQTELLKCGDVNPNPGPEVDTRVHRYTLSELYELRPQSHGVKLPPSTWTTIKNLRISPRPFYHRGKRGGRRKLRPTACSNGRQYECDPSLLGAPEPLEPKKIPVIIRPRLGCLRPYHELERSTQRYLATIKKQPRQGYHLPIVLLTNLRSLSNKRDEVETVANQHTVDVIAISETWEKQDMPPEHMSMHGYINFSKARIGKSGVGVACYVKQELRPTLPNVKVPDDIEALWLVLKPAYLPRTMSCIVLCVTYYPPRNGNADSYLNHFTSAIDNFLMKYPDAGIAILGDTNDLDIQPLLTNNRFKQVVDQPTRGESVLDKIVTNFPDMYSGVSILSPVGRSDHNCVLWTPLRQPKRPQSTTRKKVARPLKDSGMRSVGQWITQESWDSVIDAEDVSTKCANLMRSVQEQIDLHLPTRLVKLHSADRPWMTAEVKTAINERQRAFGDGDKPRWRHLRNKVIRSIARAKENYYNKRVRNLKTSNPSAWYRQIKVLTQGSTGSPPISIPGLDQNSVDPVKAANAINDHFLSIASDLPPLNRKMLPAFLPSPCVCPGVQQWDVYQHLKSLNLQKAGTTSDLPVRIIREFACELSVPLTDIINSSFEKGEVPVQWKYSQITPVPKSLPPTIDKLRPIALTSYFAKIAESFAAKWLLEDIEKHLDPKQFGNRPGLSTLHYLVSLLHQLFKHC